MPPLPNVPITLVAAESLSHNVRLLRFAPAEPLHWKPGQFVSLKMPQPDGSVLARSYSIASQPIHDGTFELAVTLVEEGPGSTYLHTIAPGAALECGHPMGFFTLPDTVTRPIVWVATGTGITPIRAMLQQAAGGHVAMPMALVHGVRTEEDRIFAAEFSAMAERLPHFSYTATLSRPPAAWTGRTGYVQTHVEALVAEVGAPCDVYVCGLSPMIKAVRAVLKDTLGFARDQIHTERFD